MYNTLSLLWFHIFVNTSYIGLLLGAWQDEHGIESERA